MFFVWWVGCGRGAPGSDPPERKRKREEEEEEGDAGEAGGRMAEDERPSKRRNLGTQGQGGGWKPLKLFTQKNKSSEKMRLFLIEIIFFTCDNFVLNI